MQTISSLNPARAPRRIIAISIGLLSTLLLASCGGGGSTDPNATAQSVDDGTKTIQAVSGSTAVSGTWTGRAPKMEVINGITVPPEPAPSINNATLAGVDANNNGVRDDVERMLAAASRDVGSFSQGLFIAKSYQRITTSVTALSITELNTIYGAILCRLRNQASAGAVKTGAILNSILNTQDRISSFRTATNNYNGYFSGDLPACQ